MEKSRRLDLSDPEDRSAWDGFLNVTKAVSVGFQVPKREPLGVVDASVVPEIPLVDIWVDPMSLQVIEITSNTPVSPPKPPVEPAA